ncbi:MAG: hypothetical protein WC516_06325 [Patescibacteria group bacterium]
MKKLILAVVMIMLFVGNSFAYKPDSFKDEETINVYGQRPKVDIEVSEIEVRILAEDFIDGVANKSVRISNEGSVPCHLAIELGQVPVDLQVSAKVDDDFLLKNASTDLNIVVELTDQQEVEDFTFTILIKASLRP